MVVGVDTPGEASLGKSVRKPQYPVPSEERPPVVVVWCDPPTAKKSMRTDCVYFNKKCEGASKTCPLCEFPYCASHFPRHSRRIECPADVWLEFERRRRRWYEIVKANPKARPQVNVKFPKVPGG